MMVYGVWDGGSDGYGEGHDYGDSDGNDSVWCMLLCRLGILQLPSTTAPTSLPWWRPSTRRSVKDRF